MKTTINNLIRLANILDEEGFYSIANKIDNTIRKIANKLTPYQQALMLQPAQQPEPKAEPLYKSEIDPCAETNNYKATIKKFFTMYNQAVAIGKKDAFLMCVGEIFFEEDNKNKIIEMFFVEIENMKKDLARTKCNESYSLQKNNSLWNLIKELNKIGFN